MLPQLLRLPKRKELAAAPSHPAGQSPSPAPGTSSSRGAAGGCRALTSIASLLPLFPPRPAPLRQDEPPPRSQTLQSRCPPAAISGERCIRKVQKKKNPKTSKFKKL